MCESRNVQKLRMSKKHGVCKVIGSVGVGASTSKIKIKVGDIGQFQLKSQRFCIRVGLSARSE